MEHFLNRIFKKKIIKPKWTTDLHWKEFGDLHNTIVRLNKLLEQFLVLKLEVKEIFENESILYHEYNKNVSMFENTKCINDGILFRKYIKAFYKKYYNTDINEMYIYQSDIDKIKDYVEKHKQKLINIKEFLKQYENLKGKHWLWCADFSIKDIIKIIDYELGLSKDKPECYFTFV